jgi:hypothetical protein
MGVKDWLARSVLGPQGYGSAMGRQAREGGSALANAVFLSHGSRPGGGPAAIFDTLPEMEAAGFKPRYEGLSRLDITSLTLDEQRFFKSLTMAMISYAFIVNSNGALQSMRRDNTSKFRNGLGPSLLQSTVDCGLFGDIEAARAALLSYIRLTESSSISTILNKEKPASGDLLEHFIIRSIEASGAKAQYGVVRTGITGFDTVAVPLAGEILKSIVVAARQYGW